MARTRQRACSGRHIAPVFGLSRSSFARAVHPHLQRDSMSIRRWAALALTVAALAGSAMVARAEGWVLHSLLSGRRTAFITVKTKSRDDLVPLHASADAKSAVVAQLQAGVLGTVKRCGESWCRI